MDWQTLNSDALKAIMDGDRWAAISAWKVAVELVEAANLMPTAELARLYYSLGKCYLDEGQRRDALRLIGRAEKILLEVAPEDPDLKKIQYDLGGVLLKLGQKDAASSAFAGGYSNTPVAECLRGVVEAELPVADAIALLQKNGLVLELSPDLRQELSREVEADGYAGCASLVELADLLYCYYQKDYRCVQDKVLRMQDFDSLPDLLVCDLIDRFNNFFQSAIVGCDEIVCCESEFGKQYFVAPNVNIGQEQRFRLAGYYSLVHLYNYRLQQSGSQWRILNLLCEAGPLFIVLPIQVAVNLYMKGVRNIFDCLSQDLEPPELL